MKASEMGYLDMLDFVKKMYELNYKADISKDWYKNGIIFVNNHKNIEIFCFFEKNRMIVYPYVPEIHHNSEFDCYREDWCRIYNQVMRADYYLERELNLMKERFSDMFDTFDLMETRNKH